MPLARRHRRPVIASTAAAVLLAVAMSACHWLDGATPTRPSPSATPVVHATAPPMFGTSADTWPAATAELVAADGVRHTISLRIAEEPQQRRQGLMGVEEVPPGTGMLFVWDGSARDGGFWMKDTLVPLDIAYVRQGTIVDVQRMEPCTDYDDASEDCPGYPPAEAYDTALEVPADWFTAHDIGVGSTLRVTR